MNPQLFTSFDSVSKISAENNVRRCNLIFYVSFGVIELIMIGLFPLNNYLSKVGNTNITFTMPDSEISYFITEFQKYYKIHFDIVVMMLVGYGFLIVYLKFHRWMSLTLTFFAVMISMQLYTFWSGLWNKAFSNSFYSSKNPENVFNTLWFVTNISAMKGAITVLITLGTLIGKIDQFEMLIVVLLEILFYSLNEYILFRGIGVRDIGGSMYIHTFGAFWGLISSWIYSPKSNCLNNPNIKSTYGSATLAFVGTFFLWVYFPAFNCYNQVMFRNDYGINSTSMNTPLFKEMENIKYLCIMNTFWALTSSTILSLLTSMIIKKGKVNIDHMIHAPLSGGIMIAACCDMFAMPYPSLLVGAFAGLVSTLSLEFFPPLFSRCYYYDTRNVFCVHGIPGIFGGIASAIAASTLDAFWFSNSGNASDFNRDFFPRNRQAYYQGGFQIVGLLVSIGISIVGGLISGLILRIWRAANLPEDTFGDHVFFKMIQEESNFSNLKTGIENSQLEQTMNATIK